MSLGSSAWLLGRLPEGMGALAHLILMPGNFADKPKAETAP